MKDTAPFLQLREPIVQAPLAGGPSTVELTVAVCQAGGLGFLAAGYRDAASVAEEIAAVRAQTERPFGVNVFVPASGAVDHQALTRYAQRVRAVAEGYGTTVGDARDDDDGWEAKITLLAEERVPIVSFTFGCPPAEVVERLHHVGSAIWATITDVDEALSAVQAGADALVVQGSEAGGHRGSFCDRDGTGEIGLLALLRLVADAVDCPLVAAGGLADGAGVAAVLAAGARAAQLGTAFLRTPEAGTSPAHRQALARPGRTALTRAFTGRRGRGIVNRFLTEHSADAPAAYPHVHRLTAPLRAAARERQDPELINLWAGEAFPLARELPAGKLVRQLGREAREALDRARSALG